MPLHSHPVLLRAKDVVGRWLHGGIIARAFGIVGDSPVESHLFVDLSPEMCLDVHMLNSITSALFAEPMTIQSTLCRWGK